MRIARECLPVVSTACCRRLAVVYRNEKKADLALSFIFIFFFWRLKKRREKVGKAICFFFFFKQVLLRFPK